MTVTVIIGTDSNIDEILSTNKRVVVDVWADWCGPCKAFAPVFEQTASENTDFVFVKVEVDYAKVFVANHTIRSIPTLLVFVDGVVQDTRIGACNQSQFMNFLAKNV